MADEEATVSAQEDEQPATSPAFTIKQPFSHRAQVALAGDREFDVTIQYGSVLIRAKEKGEGGEHEWISIDAGTTLIRQIAAAAMERDPWGVHKTITESPSFFYVMLKIRAEAIGEYISRRKKQRRAKRLEYSDSTAFKIDGKYLKTITGYVTTKEGDEKVYHQYTGYGLSDSGAAHDMLMQARVDFPEIELWESKTGEDHMDIWGWSEEDK